MSDFNDENGQQRVLFNDFPFAQNNLTYEEAETQLKTIFPLLNNEIIDFMLIIQLNSPSNKRIKLFATNWAIRCIYDSPISENSTFHNFVIPLKTIVQLKKTGNEKLKIGKYGVKIYFSSGGHLIFRFPINDELRTKFIKRIEHLKLNVLHFETKKWNPNPIWIQHLIESSQYELFKNDFCQTYPRFFLIPWSIPLSFIHESSLCRSRERFPILTYIYKKEEEQVALLRSSQPLNNIAKTNGKFEQEYLAKVCNGKPLFIVDCRPKKDAVAYQFIGKGYENIKEFKKYISDVSFHFLGIPHAYKLQKWYIEMLSDLFEEKENATKKWGELIMQLLDSSSLVVEKMMSLHVVLVHCSDGWDRTSQICALCQIMIDSKWRTIHGFIELLQKDWIDMGHTFCNRCSHLESEDYGEASPIFAQFIDAIAQLIEKYPTEFEFNLLFLEIVLSNAYSQLFGDFMGNNYKERSEMERPTSLFFCFDDDKYGFAQKIKNDRYIKSDAVLLMKRNENYKFFSELIGTPVFFAEGVPELVGDPPSFPEFDIASLDEIAASDKNLKNDNEENINSDRLENNDND